MNALQKEETTETETKDVDGVAGERLRSFVERIERLTEEKAALSEDIKEVFLESKGAGFDTKAIRTVVKLRAMDAQARAEEESILDTYKAAIGLT